MWSFCNYHDTPLNSFHPQLLIISQESLKQIKFWSSGEFFPEPLEAKYIKEKIDKILNID